MKYLLVRRNGDMVSTSFKILKDFFFRFFTTTFQIFWNTCSRAVWCGADLSQDIQRFLTPAPFLWMNMSLASEALRFLIFWNAIKFSPKIGKKCCLHVLLIIFSPLFCAPFPWICTWPEKLSYFWFMIFLDAMVTSRNVLFYFLLFSLPFDFTLHMNKCSPLWFWKCP